jgi:hypothetical protein
MIPVCCISTGGFPGSLPTNPPVSFLRAKEVQAFLSLNTTILQYRSPRLTFFFPLCSLTGKNTRGKIIRGWPESIRSREEKYDSHAV